MTKDVKRFIYKILILAALIYIPFICFNLATKEVFGLNPANKDQPNSRFMKIKLLISGKIKADSFVFGSSRVWFNITTPNKHDVGYYNMSSNEGIPYEHLQDIKALIKNGVKIRNIIIGIDDISYLVSPEHHLALYGLSKYPDNVFELYYFYAKNLLEPIPLNVFLEVIRRKIYSYKNVNVPENEFIKDQWNEEHKYTVPHWNSYYKERISLSVNELKQIVDICKTNSIHLVIFVNPMHVVTYKRQNMEDYFRFLKELSFVVDYYDFAGVNKITSNNIYYHDTIHYKPFVRDLIMNKIFGEENEYNFGYYVTSKNIDEHISKLKNELR